MGGLMYEATIGGQKFNIKEQMKQPAKVEQTEQPSPVAVQWMVHILESEVI